MELNKQKLKEAEKTIKQRKKERAARELNKKKRDKQSKEMLSGAIGSSAVDYVINNASRIGDALAKEVPKKMAKKAAAGPFILKKATPIAGAVTAGYELGKVLSKTAPAQYAGDKVADAAEWVSNTAKKTNRGKKQGKYRK